MDEDEDSTSPSLLQLTNFRRPKQSAVTAQSAIKIVCICGKVACTELDLANAETRYNELVTELREKIRKAEHFSAHLTKTRSNLTNEDVARGIYWSLIRHRNWTIMVTTFNSTLIHRERNSCKEYVELRSRLDIILQTLSKEIESQILMCQLFLAPQAKAVTSQEPVTVTEQKLNRNGVEHLYFQVSQNEWKAEQVPGYKTDKLKEGASSLLVTADIEKPTGSDQWIDGGISSGYERVTVATFSNQIHSMQFKEPFAVHLENGQFSGAAETFRGKSQSSVPCKISNISRFDSDGRINNTKDKAASCSEDSRNVGKEDPVKHLTSIYSSEQRIAFREQNLNKSQNSGSLNLAKTIPVVNVSDLSDKSVRREDFLNQNPRTFADNVEMVDDSLCAERPIVIGTKEGYCAHAGKPDSLTPCFSQERNGTSVCSRQITANSEEILKQRGIISKCGSDCDLTSRGGAPSSQGLKDYGVPNKPSLFMDWLNASTDASDLSSEGAKRMRLEHGMEQDWLTCQLKQVHLGSDIPSHSQCSTSTQFKGCPSTGRASQEKEVADVLEELEFLKSPMLVSYTYNR